VSAYETDEEKVEAIKKWWKENGMSVLTGMAVGLAVVFGWRAWTEYRNSVGAQASAAFEQLLISADAGEAQSTAKQAQLLAKDFGSTPYPALGSLVAARVLYDHGDATAAMNALKAVIDKAPDPALACIAALRLARIQLAEGQLDAAAATIGAHDQGAAFAGEFAAIRGDIAAARGDTAGARAAWEKALSAGAGLPQLLRLKLDNLPAAG
jgi:predicted negative regulator of RcsB-dependent stress response